MDLEGNDANEAEGVGLVTPMVLRWLIGLFGAGLLVAGAAAVFVTVNGTGSAALIASGVALIALALLAPTDWSRSKRSA